MKLKALGLLLLGSIAWAQVPQSRHVWIIAEENHSYETVIGNSSMPFYNSLIAKYGLATQYYSEEHNSISALMWLIAGQPVTGDNSTTSCYNLNNIGRQLIASGYSWRSYQEDLPYPGFTGISNLNYVRRHNPIIDFTDTCAASQANNSVPFTQLATDIAEHKTPNYAYITPNLLNDAHNGPLAAADLWLSAHVPAILALPEFQPGGDGILFIQWDEADLSSDGYTQDNRCTSAISDGCGGRVATLVIGPQVKTSYKSSVRYDHANLLRTICDVMALSSCPGAGAVANPMSDFFNQVNIATPLANANVSSPVRVQASTSNSSPVSAMQIYVDNVLKYQVAANSINTSLPISAGRHYLVVQSWDTTGGIHKRGVYVNVNSKAVVVTNPAPGSVVGSPVQVSATAGGQTPITKMQLYVDGNSQFQSSGNTLNTSIALKAGTHSLSVEASDSAGNLANSTLSVTSSTPSVTVLSPTPNASFYSPMYVAATSIDPTPVTSVQIYVDNQLVYQVSGTGVQATLPLSVGKHWVVVQEWNSSGATYKKGVWVNVSAVPITIASPKANANVGSSVTIAASAPANSPVHTMQIYIDGALVSSASSQSISQSFNLASGQHHIVAKGWDAAGDNWSTDEDITVK
ncbi:MAG TPA: alkaline phosphatase family protein [Terriglobales bacterium]|nr:alkaline phosphatase family protein [Terriglobales bacterium]